jgi:hypothetical protein
MMKEEKSKSMMEPREEAVAEVAAADAGAEQAG